MNNKLTADDIRNVARQSALALTEEDAKRILEDLGKIMEDAAALQDVDVAGVEPMVSPIFGRNTPLREDVVEQGLTQEEALRGTSHKGHGHFRVPKTIEG